MADSPFYQMKSGANFKHYFYVNSLKDAPLARGRTSFHLSTLEATYIKTSKPNLCKQKEFVYGLKITH